MIKLYKSIKNIKTCQCKNINNCFYWQQPCMLVTLAVSLCVLWLANTQPYTQMTVSNRSGSDYLGPA